VYDLLEVALHRGRRAIVAALVAVTATLAGCAEDITGGTSCPQLCPEQGLSLRDTLITGAVTLDTTLLGYPPLGTEGQLMLARRGDTLETAAAIRFDTVLATIQKPNGGGAATIEALDTASLSLPIFDTPILKTAAVAFELYNVDTAADELDTAAVRVLFRPDRLLSTRTVPADSVAAVVVDSIRLPVPTAFLLPRVKGGLKVRLGVRVVSDSSVAVRVLSRESGLGPLLRYLGRAGTDTQTITMRSSTRGADPSDANASVFADLTVLLRAPSLLTAGSLAVGGLPGTRSYLRFALPEALVKSATIVRATLVLTQRPNPAIDASDSITIGARMVRASTRLDAAPGKAALLLLDQALIVTPTVRVLPSDSGQKLIEIAAFLRGWRLEDAATTPRAVVLQAGDEGNAPHAALFFSSEAAVDSLRPRLRLTYVPNARFGLP
jgi:hypothetical protein